MFLRRCSRYGSVRNRYGSNDTRSHVFLARNKLVRPLVFGKGLDRDGSVYGVMDAG
jgi:hypothetical protein